MAQGFAKALERHSRELRTLEGDQAQEFLRLLKNTQEALRARLASVLPGDSSLNAFVLRQLVAETEHGILVLEDKANQLYAGAVDQAVDLSIEHISDELERLSSAFDAAPLNVSIDALKVLTDPAQGLLASHFETSVKRYGMDMLNGVRRELFVGMRTGDTLGSIVQKISGMQGPLGAVGKSSGERLVRTEVSNAYGSAQHSGLEQASHQVPGLKKVWLHVGSFLCKTCGPLHGTERPLDGTWTIGKRKVAHAPGHPNCTCRVSAMKKSWRQGLERLGYLQEQPETNEPGRAAL